MEQAGTLIIALILFMFAVAIGLSFYTKQRAEKDKGKKLSNLD